MIERDRAAGRARPDLHARKVLEGEAVGRELDGVPPQMHGPEFEGSACGPVEVAAR